MAKKERPAKKAAAPVELPKGHVGVDYVAKGLKVKEATARVILRDNKIKRTGRSYSWPKAEADKIIKRLAA